MDWIWLIPLVLIIVFGNIFVDGVKTAIRLKRYKSEEKKKG